MCILQYWMSWRLSWLESRESYSRVCMEEFLNLELTTFCMSWTRLVLDDVPSSSIFRVEEWRIFFDYILVQITLDLEVFSSILRGCTLDWISVQCSNLSGWDVMSKGGMEIDHHMGELATCHSSSWWYMSPSWNSFMHRRLADNILLVVEEICAVDQMIWSQYSIGRWVNLHTHRRTQKSAIDVDLVCGVLVSSTPYSGFWVNLVQLIAWAEDTYIGSTLYLLCFDIEQFILSKWWEYTAGNSWRRVRVSWRYLMERTYQTVSFGTTRCIGIVRTMVVFEHLICLKICVMRCFGVVRTIPTSSSSCSLGRCLSSTRTTLLFF